MLVSNGVAHILSVVSISIVWSIKIEINNNHNNKKGARSSTRYVYRSFQWLVLSSIICRNINKFYRQHVFFFILMCDANVWECNVLHAALHEENERSWAHIHTNIPTAAFNYNNIQFNWIQFDFKSVDLFLLLTRFHWRFLLYKSFNLFPMSHITFIPLEKT